jgi:uncharacterized protein YkwD
MKFTSTIYLLLIASLAACGGGSDVPAPGAGGSPAAATANPGSTPTSSPAGGAASESTALGPATSCNLPNFQADILQAVNAARAKARTCGAVAMPAVGAVQWSDVLFASAAGHSQDMAQRNYFDHVSPEGVSAGQRATNAGYRFANLGENIAAGQANVAAVMASWLGSAGHCENIMTAAFTEMAVACVATTRPQYPTYWTMELAKPR